MKKIITSVFVLANVLAHAQEGTVGINTMTPKATLEVQPTATNLTGTTNEGIIAPKLSKERIAAIATPVEGTLVYATDATYAGSDAKVAKITEKGYYYYNGTEWVKSGVGANDQEWVYDATTNRINLKRSGGNLFENTVFYNKNGALQNYDFNSYPLFYANTGTTTVRTVDMDNEFGNNLYKKTSNINFGTETKYVLNRNLLYVDDSTSENLSLTVEGAALVVPSTNAKNYTLLIGNGSSAKHSGIGNAKYIVGGYFDGRLEGTGYSDGYVYGLRATASYGTDKSSNHQTGVGVFNQVMPTGSGTITSMYDYNAYKSFFNDSPLSVTNVRGYNAIITYSSAMGGTVSIDDARGFNYDGLNIVSGFKISTKKNYGLYIGNIAGGTELNRAIHTEAGKIRFGDLADASATADRVVTVDADGVLKVGTSTTAPTVFKWVEDATNTSVKLAVNSAGTDRTTAPVSITDTGMVKATSFQGSNGATIFPDYVFQKYYDGVSDIKADYTFKSLSQVEDFVKTNGHLPGYKSAAAIKAQGYVDLMETQLTNVEKIEELYLHSIEQEKNLKELKNQNDELKAKNQELETRLEKLEKLLK
ncbi:hypothetical protein ACFFUE_02565 [Bergeyella porcorum]|uniref:hypothetical protein n=1 Tax=Bergeyella porcorum TaxID=1735111 RepID=UPI0035E52CB7